VTDNLDLPPVAIGARDRDVNVRALEPRVGSNRAPS
jgi:hypothetical protein